MSPIPYKYSYFLGVSVFVIIWLALFLRKKTFRREMILLGLLGAGFGPLANYIWYTRDWWNPPNVLGLSVGIEDFLMGLTNTGIIAVIYEEAFNRRYKSRTFEEKLDIKAVGRLVLFMLLSLTPMIVCFYLLHWHSFWANALGLLFGGLFVLFVRPDLWKDSLWTALLVPLITMPAFWLPELLSPGWVDRFWMFSNLSGHALLKIPIEDLIWYSLVGFCLGSVYEYMFKLKLKR